MLIGIGGKKNAGKNVSASFFQDKGFKLISFADPLKKFVAEIYNWELNDLYDPVKKEQRLTFSVEWNKATANKLEKLAGLPQNVLDQRTMWMTTKRFALQFIGTEILREYDTDFHVKQFLKLVTPNEDFVTADVRFENELNYLKQNGAWTIYIVRPEYDSLAGAHASENALTGNEFDVKVINDGTLTQLHEKLAYEFNEKTNKIKIRKEH